MPFESNELDLLIVVHMYALWLPVFLQIYCHFLHVYLFSYKFIALNAGLH